MLLEIEHLGITFGGLAALSDFNFALDDGELVGLIGPNGAGKTTAFNLATGMYAPTAGHIRFDGRRIDGLPVHRINRLGIARTFQNIRLFGGLSVLDNVLIGMNQRVTHGLCGTLVRSVRYQREEESQIEHAMDLLGTFGLADSAGQIASGLPYGDQRRLEIVRALATNPKLLLLDEPAAGMNPQEKQELMRLIRFIRQHFAVGIWLIEHDMKLVMGVCERITVLDHGQIIAVGTPQEIRSDPKVIEAYLGRPLEETQSGDSATMDA